MITKLLEAAPQDYDCRMNMTIYRNDAGQEVRHLQI